MARQVDVRHGSLSRSSDALRRRIRGDPRAPTAPATVGPSLQSCIPASTLRLRSRVWSRTTYFPTSPSRSAGRRHTARERRCSPDPASTATRRLDALLPKAICRCTRRSLRMQEAAIRCRSRRWCTSAFSSRSPSGEHQGSRSTASTIASNSSSCSRRPASIVMPSGSGARHSHDCMVWTSPRLNAPPSDASPGHGSPRSVRGSAMLSRSTCSDRATSLRDVHEASIAVPAIRNTKESLVAQARRIAERFAKRKSA